MAIVVDQLKFTPPANLTSTAASQVVQLTAGGNLILALPGSSRFSANAFQVYAAGYAQSGPGTFTATVQPILYGDASLATVTTKPLFTSTAGTLAYTGTAAAGAAIPWAIYANIIGDQVSGTFTGEAESAVGTAYKIRTALTAPVSTINFNTEPCIKFAIGNTGGGTVGTNFKFVVETFQVIDD
jgi:hypothetical protein